MGQHLAKELGLKYNYYFLRQDKNLLGIGTTQEVIDHMNALAEGVARAVQRHGHCRKIHLVDCGGDVLVTVLTPSVFSTEEEATVQASHGVRTKDLDMEPRKERDVWNLILALALKDILNCAVQLVVVAPGIDGQSVWLGPLPNINKEDIEASIPHE